ncbi:CG42714 [Drosophila busckii]|uniref:CG42714 n=1 Tax=Drosophila busckii TaxID=30019 RepID=A0A0M4F0A9_DROBS|nr:uncharacterized protein LOC108599367 [Drosophila busckii]ALC44512.1 CG42714 [Drosophila busckii]
MLNKFICLSILLQFLLSSASAPPAPPSPPPPPCGLERNCGKVNESSAVCRYDAVNGCIRKYASKCHLEIAACKERTVYRDYSDVYCSMETFLCEESSTYERWTIFFGYAKD